MFVGINFCGYRGESQFKGYVNLWPMIISIQCYWLLYFSEHFISHGSAQPRNPQKLVITTVLQILGVKT